MKSALRSIEWIMGSSALLFYGFGRFIAPHYELMLVNFDEMFSGAENQPPVPPLSKYCIGFAYFLVVLLAIRIVYRWKKR